MGLLSPPNCLRGSKNQTNGFENKSGFTKVSPRILDFPDCDAVRASSFSSRLVFRTKYTQAVWQLRRPEGIDQIGKGVDLAVLRVTSLKFLPGNSAYKLVAQNYSREFQNASCVPPPCSSSSSSELPADEKTFLFGEKLMEDGGQTSKEFGQTRCRRRSRLH